MTDVRQLAAKLNQEIAEQLTKTLQAMPEDKLSWQPLGEGRSALNQAAEIGFINGFMAQIVADQAVPEFNRDEYMRTRNETDTLHAALALMGENTDKLVTACKGLPEEKLDDTITLPFLGGMKKALAEVMLMPYWNMTYHLGQINYIQTLYGDKEMH